MTSLFSLWPISFPILQAILLLSTFSLLCVYILAFGGPLGRIPGPFSARLSKSWLVRHSWDGEMHRTMIELHQKYGKLIRTGPNEVSISDLSAIKRIYGAGTKFRKSSWYSVWQGRRKFDLFAERDEKIHGQQRRLVSNIYAMESLKDLEKYVDDAIARFIDIMHNSQNKSFNMGRFVQLFAFGKIQSFCIAQSLKASDVIGEVCYALYQYCQTH